MDRAWRGWLRVGREQGKSGAKKSAPLTGNGPLLLIDEVTAAVLLPAGFVFFHTERLFFAVADGLDARGIDSSRHKSALYRRSALVAESQVVFRRATRVAVAFDGEVDVGMLIQELRIRLDRRLLVATNVRLVVFEVDILHV